MHTIVFLRHGQSVYNAKDIFTGWIDAGLSPRGVKEANLAGKILKENGFIFDLIFNSVLKRAYQTSEIVVKKMGLKNIEVVNAWQLNERHYGALQGQNKKEVLAKYGSKNFFIWRRSFATPPPALAKSAKGYQVNAPLTESLADVLKRALPYWQEKIVPAIKLGKHVLVSTHGSTIRALVKYLDNISDNDIANVNIPTGIPLVYQLDNNLKPLRHYYLADKKKLSQAIAEVAQQGLR